MSVYACGVLLSAPDHTLLLMRRDSSGTFPGQWGVPAGRREHGEPLHETMMRELFEETGYTGTVRVTRRAFLPLGPTSSSTFCLFEGTVARKFMPKLNAEHDLAGWFPVDELPSPLHPGLRFLLPRGR